MTRFCIWFSSLWLSTNSEWIINDVCCSEQTIKFSRLSKPNGISSRSRRLCSNTSAPLFFFSSFSSSAFCASAGKCLTQLKPPYYFIFNFFSQFIFWQLNSASQSLRVERDWCAAILCVNKQLIVQENSASFTTFQVKHGQCRNIEVSWWSEFSAKLTKFWMKWCLISNCASGCAVAISSTVHWHHNKTWCFSTGAASKPSRINFSLYR